MLTGSTSLLALQRTVSLLSLPDLGHAQPWTRHGRLWLALAGSWPTSWVKTVQKYFHKEN